MINVIRKANMQFLNVKTPKADADVTNANIAFGEFYMGNAGKAISIMNSIIYSDDFDKTDMLVKAHYLINLVMYMMGSDPDGNMESIDRMRYTDFTQISNVIRCRI